MVVIKLYARIDIFKFVLYDLLATSSEYQNKLAKIFHYDSSFMSWNNKVNLRNDFNFISSKKQNKISF